MKNLYSAMTALSTAAFLFLTIFSTSSHACTTFCLNNGEQIIFGKNYDWNIDHGLVIVNKRNMHKSTTFGSAQETFQWTSTYGSITFNQYGRELPSGGINEAGLVIELLWLEQTQYPKPDDRVEFGSTHWIQYQLDTAGSTDQLIANCDDVRIKSVAKIHFLVTDRSGNTATIEFLKGKLKVHKGKQLKGHALANSSYGESLKYLQKYNGFGGKNGLPASQSSLDRFVRASALMANYDAVQDGPAVDYAFDVLANVAQGSYTQWSIVYDVSNMEIHFRTRREQKIKTIPLGAMDFSCQTPVQVLNINNKFSGDVSARFSDYTRKANRRLIGNSFGNTSFLRNVPAESLDSLAEYPESATCAHAE